MFSVSSFRIIYRQWEKRESIEYLESQPSFHWLAFYGTAWVSAITDPHFPHSAHFETSPVLFRHALWSVREARESMGKWEGQGSVGKEGENASSLSTECSMYKQLSRVGPYRHLLFSHFLIPSSSTVAMAGALPACNSVSYYFMLSWANWAFTGNVRRVRLRVRCRH